MKITKQNIFYSMLAVGLAASFANLYHYASLDHPERQAAPFYVVFIVTAFIFLFSIAIYRPLTSITVNCLYYLFGVPISYGFWPLRKKQYRRHASNLAERLHLLKDSVGVVFQVDDMFGYDSCHTLIVFNRDAKISGEQKQKFALLLLQGLSERIKKLGYSASIRNLEERRLTYELFPISKNMNEFIADVFCFAPDSDCIKIGCCSEIEFINILKNI